MTLDRRRAAATGLATLLWAGAARTQPRAARHAPDPARKALLDLGVEATRIKLLAFNSLRQAQQAGRIRPEAFNTLQFAGLDEDDNQVFWTFFLRGAIIFVGHADSPRPVIGYFNPVLDFWWLTSWTRSGGAPQVAVSRLIPGGALNPGTRSTPPPPEPGLMRHLDRSSVLSQLQATAARANKEFATVFPLPGVGTSDDYFEEAQLDDHKRLMFNRIYYMIRNISKFAKDRAAYGAYQALLGDCDGRVVHDPARYTADSAKTLAEVLRAPPPVISNLSPLGAFQAAGLWCVVSGTPLYSRFELLSLIAPGPSGGTVQRLALVDVNDATPY